MRQILLWFVITSVGMPVTAWSQTGIGEFQWTTATPESQGMSSQKLDAMRDDLATRKTSGLLVIRNDKIVCEWYAPGQSAKSKHGTASMAKAIVGGVSLAVAISDGRIALDDPAAKFIPQWRDDPQKSRITIRQLGSHTSGIEDAEEGNLPHNKLTGWKGDFWQPADPPRDSFTVSRDAAPVLFEPGTKMAYSNPGIAMLTYAVTASLKDGPQKDVRTLLRDRVMRPLGVPDQDWSVGYGRTPVVDGLPLVGSWGGAAYTARAVARVGRLMLREGDWEGRRLISADAVRQVTRDVGTPGNCGIGWWSNNDGSYPELPRDAYCGTGAGHQIVLVIPSLSLIAVRNGDTMEAAGGEPNAYHAPLRRYLFKPLVDAVIAAPIQKTEPAQPVPQRAAWMQEARWGVMTHYLADWKSREQNEPMSIEKWNEMIDHFDVEALAEQLKSVGVGYYLVTIGQNSGYYLSPNATYDRLVGIQPSKCSQRDLIADLYAAMHQRGIKLMVYLPAGAPGGDATARQALQWQNGPNRNREFQLKWEQVIRAWSTRWGRNVAGWWFDGCYWPNTMYRSEEAPNFASFAAAARAGNPDSIVAFNPGVVPRILSVTPHEDYTAGEINDPNRVEIRRTVEGRIDGTQVHILSYLGRTWGMGAPRFSAEQVVTWSQRIRKQGGAITWDVPIQPNGLIAQPFIDQLTAVGQTLGPR
ncbi:MAG: serine hydrolase [Phycisphaerae bacterium]|nr:serine hydrolase [Phycisphaerae bacterium]